MQSVLVPWPFAPLASRERRTVRVRVWGADGSGRRRGARPPRWRPACWRPATGPRGSSTPDWDEDTTRDAALLRCCGASSTLRAGVTQARLYVTALGVYEASSTARRSATTCSAPGWTSYEHRLRYQTFDVTALLREGANALGAMLGDGWYRGRLGFGGGRRNIYGDRLALLAQLEISYADGTTERVVHRRRPGAPRAGRSWPATSTTARRYDARLERPGWSAPGFDDARLGRRATARARPRARSSRPPARRCGASS